MVSSSVVVRLAAFALCGVGALELAPRRASTASTPGLRRRDVFGAAAAAAALGLGAAPPAFAESVPTPEELKKLTLGYERMNLLLTDWDRITSGKCYGKLSQESKQVVATNGGASCDKDPLKVQEYIGFKSINDPLFKSEKLMLRASPLLKNPNDTDRYLEAVNKWGEKIQMSSMMAYTSSWGEANPNGGKGQVDAFLEDTKLDVEESVGLLKSILLMLGLPLKSA